MRADAAQRAQRAWAARVAGATWAQMAELVGYWSHSRPQLQRAWRKAAKGLGLGEFHLHDRRHAGVTTAAQAGATVRELMDRAGHSTARAAMAYQHAA